VELVHLGAFLQESLVPLALELDGIGDQEVGQVGQCPWIDDGGDEVVGGLATHAFIWLPASAGCTTAHMLIVNLESIELYTVQTNETSILTFVRKSTARVCALYDLRRRRRTRA
jgi:hypothetical protein